MPGQGKWASTPRERRKRKGLFLTISDEARAKLDRIAGEGLRSALVEKLILEMPEQVYVDDRPWKERHPKDKS